MNIAITKTTGVEYPPVFQKILEDVAGGVTFDVDDLPTAIEFLEEGVMLTEDCSTDGLYHVCKTLKTYAEIAVSAVSITVLKAHLFVVGDFITNGQVSTAITAIDTTTSALYDTITITATLDATEAVPISTVLYQGSSETTNTATASTAAVTDEATETLTVSNPLGNTNDVVVTIAAAGADTMAVTYTPTTKVLLIALAGTTASKNNAAAIQTAIRALLVEGGIDFSGWTAVGGTGWDGGQTGDTLTDPTNRMADGIAKPLNMPAKYTPEVMSGNQMDVEIANPSCSGVVRGTVTEALMPYFATAAQKTSLNLIRFQ